jgi:hypothetical protein
VLVANSLFRGVDHQQIDSCRNGIFQKWLVRFYRLHRKEIHPPPNAFRTLSQHLHQTTSPGLQGRRQTARLPSSLFGKQAHILLLRRLRLHLHRLLRLFLRRLLLRRRLRVLLLRRHRHLSSLLSFLVLNFPDPLSLALSPAS